MENVVTLGKLIGLLFCSLPPLYFVFDNSKNTRNELARPVMETIFLVTVERGGGGGWIFRGRLSVHYAVLIETAVIVKQKSVVVFSASPVLMICTHKM